MINVDNDKNDNPLRPTIPLFCYMQVFPALKIGRAEDKFCFVLFFGKQFCSFYSISFCIRQMCLYTYSLKLIVYKI